MEFELLFPATDPGYLITFIFFPGLIARTYIPFLGRITKKIEKSLDTNTVKLGVIFSAVIIGMLIQIGSTVLTPIIANFLGILVYVNTDNGIIITGLIDWLIVISLVMSEGIANGLKNKAGQLLIISLGVPATISILVNNLAILWLAIPLYITLGAIECKRPKKIKKLLEHKIFIKISSISSIILILIAYFYIIGSVISGNFELNNALKTVYTQNQPLKIGITGAEEDSTAITNIYIVNKEDYPIFLESIYTVKNNFKEGEWKINANTTIPTKIEPKGTFELQIKNECYEEVSGYQLYTTEGIYGVPARKCT